MTAKEFFKDESPEYVEMFAELARRVGTTLDDIDLGDDKAWPYAEYTWTRDEEKDYEKWLVGHIYKYRRKLEISYATKKMIRRKTVPYFILMYSWKYKDNEAFVK